MFDKEKLSLRTRLRLCWDVFTRGKYDPRDYKTIQQEEAWARCEKMRKDLASATRPRVDTDVDREWMEQ
jgi:hypothetical protein